MGWLDTATPDSVVTRNRTKSRRVTWLVSMSLVGGLGWACGSPQSAGDMTSPSPSVSISVSPYFDSNPTELLSNFAPGVGLIACSNAGVAFADGPLLTLYSTPLSPFKPHRVFTSRDTIGPISMFGSWAAFATFRQAGDQLSPAAAWSVYGVDVSSGKAVTLATGNGPIELSEVPFPTVGDGFIVWDELMPDHAKVLWRYDIATGISARLPLQADMYPVRPTAVGRRLMFLDNNRDPDHAQQVWLSRGGEPILLDLSTGQVLHLAPSSVVYAGILADSRAVWLAANGKSLDLQEASLPAKGITTLASGLGVTPLWASAHATVWLAPVSGAVTAHVGNRTAVVSPDLTQSPGGVALCGSDLYYAGPNLSLRVAHVQ